MFVHDRFNPPAVDGLSCDDESRTKQEFKDECDINRIMARALRSGQFPPAVSVGRYGDFSEVGDYQEALARVEYAREQFAGLPAKTREKFGNDPARFLEAVPKMSREEALELGLLKDEFKVTPPVPEGEKSK